MGDATEARRRTIARAAADAAERFAGRVAVRHKQDGEWREVTFAQVGELVDGLAHGLVARGLEPGDRACILANTRPEWTYCSLAISRAGGVVVPVYPTNSPEECEWVAGNAEAKIILCEDEQQAAKVEQVRSRLERLEHVLLMSDLDALRGSGDASDLDTRCEGVSPDDAYTIIYTSGTTGPPKGVVLSHGNCASVGEIVEELGFITDEDSTYLYLPLAHSFALTVQLASFDVGSSIIYFGGDPKQIVGELGETKPTYFPSVPRIFEKIYALATASEHPPEQVKAFVGSLFGGRLKQAVTGAAPIAPDILEFFQEAGVIVLEGWGMTETTGVGCVNLRDALKIGTVGRAVPGAEVRIADDGEILIRGTNVFREYWRNPEATQETFTDDGWLRTGDLGSIDDDGFVSITGRKKDIIITAGGKNLTPANIENDLKQSRWISQAVMFGDRKPYPVALITLDPEEIVPWARDKGLPEEVPSLIETDEVQQLIQDELDRANSRYARVEQIKKFRLLEHDFTLESGELTPSLKLKRNVVYDRYADAFESMYR